MVKGLFALLVFFVGSARAEYRVFLLQITDSQNNIARTVKTTLDQNQYPMIYPLKTFETIQAIDSWKCRGNTGNYKILCSKY